MWHSVTSWKGASILDRQHCWLLSHLSRERTQITFNLPARHSKQGQVFKWACSCHHFHFKICSLFSLFQHQTVNTKDMGKKDMVHVNVLFFSFDKNLLHLFSLQKIQKHRFNHENEQILLLNQAGPLNLTNYQGCIVILFDNKNTLEC